MSIYKRIISLFSTFAICISLMIVPASASELVPSEQYRLANYSKAFALGAVADMSLDYIGGAGEYLSTLWEAMKTGFAYGCPANPNGQHNFMPADVLVTSWEAALRGSEACDCRYCGISYDEFCDSTYNQYVSSLVLTTIDADGYLYYKIPFSYGQLSVSGEQSYIFKGKQYYFGNTTNESNITDWYVAEVSSMYDPTVVSFRDGGAPYAYMLSLSIDTGDFAFPIDGWYCFPAGLNTNFSVVMNDGTVKSGVNSYGYEEEEYYSAGYVRKFNLTSGTYQPNNKKKILSGTVSAPAHYLKVKPLDGLIDVMNDTAYGINTRPSTIIGDYGIIGDDGTIIKVDGNMIVDESTNIVYNPVTNTTNNYTDYTFDYTNRSYNLTLEDGSTLKVVYGDENVTIHEGDTIYNIYYLIPDDSGSGGGSDSGDTPSGEDMSWWKQAWTNFTDKLFSILGNGGSSVNPDTAPAVPDDEETGEKGYSVIDLFVVLKDGTWAFITGIVTTAYDGFTGFVESVSSAGSFFTFYDEESEDGILFVPLEGGETIWD